MAVKAVYIG